MAEHGIEGGFGSGLRAKLEAKDQPEPRSPGEAIAAAVTPDNPDLEALRAELSASLAREQELRASLNDQVEVSGREVQLEQELAEQAGFLDRRAASLAATEAEIEERERQIAQRLAELDDVLEAKEELTKGEAKVEEREQLIELKVQELKKADDERAAAAKELREKIEDIAKREQDLARAEAHYGAHPELAPSLARQGNRS